MCSRRAAMFPSSLGLGSAFRHEVSLELRCLSSLQERGARPELERWSRPSLWPRSRSAPSMDRPCRSIGAVPLGSRCSGGELFEIQRTPGTPECVCGPDPDRKPASRTRKPVSDARVCVGTPECLCVCFSVCVRGLGSGLAMAWWSVRAPGVHLAVGWRGFFCGGLVRADLPWCSVR